MKDTFFEILTFLKHPKPQEDANKSFAHINRKFFHVLAISLITSFMIMPLMVIIESLGFVDLEHHSIEELLKDKSRLFVFLMAVIVAPFFEELIFRAPLTLFKNPKVFRFAFYTSCLVFGFIHISNYEISLEILLFSPILVAPQIILGAYLGFIRVRFGFIYCVLLHACYNGLLSVGLLFA